MIIDADCHVSSRPEGVLISADELVRRLDRAGVDRAITWLTPPYFRDIEPENRYVFDSCRRFPDRLIGFGWANPRLGHQRTLDEIRRCFEEFGFAGIKFNGAQDGYVIDDPQASLPYLEAAARWGERDGKVIAFHIGADFYENTHPFRLETVAKRFPGVRFLASHMGGTALPSLSRSMIEVAQRCPNVWLIGSNVPDTEICQAIEVLGAQRVCFGSDEPYRRADYHLAGYRAMLRDLPDGDTADVLGLNVARLVGLA